MDKDKYVRCVDVDCAQRDGIFPASRDRGRVNHVHTFGIVPPP